MLKNILKEEIKKVITLENKMSILIIGGDKISTIQGILAKFGIYSITHWDTRKKSSACRKDIPKNTDFVLMLTDFINHNAMYKYKKRS